MATSAAVISQEVSDVLRSEIKVGTVKINSLTSIAADDIVVYDKQGKVFAKAEEMEVSFNLLGIMHGSPTLELVRTITLKQPVVHIEQRENKKWNYSDFLTEEKTSNAFKGKVKLENAVAEVKAEGKTVNIEEINGTLDFVSQPAISLKLAAKHKDGKIDASGTIGSSHQALSIEAENFALEDYSQFMPENMEVKVKKGKLKELKATILANHDDYKFSGETIVLGVAVDVEGTTIDQIDGLVLFNEKELRVYSRGKVAQQPVVLIGSTSLDVIEPVVNFEVKSKGFDVSKVIDTFPLQGQIAFQAHVGGKISKPAINATFSVADGQLNQYAVHDVKGKVDYIDNLVIVEELTGHALDGSFTANGQINTITEDYNVQVKVEGMDATLLSAYIPDMTGRVKADVAVTGKGLDLGNAVVYGTAGVQSGMYQGFNFDRLDTSFYKKGDHIQVDYATVNLPQGVINAEGVIQGSAIQMEFTGADIGLEQLNTFDQRLDASGLANISGTLTRTMDHPWLTAQFTAEQGQIFGQPFEKIIGSAHGDENRIDIEKFEMHDQNMAKHELKGDIGLKGNHPINLTVSTRRARAEHLMKLALPNENIITGNVDNDVTIKGTLDHLEAVGKLSMTEGSFKGILYQEASGQYSYKNGQMELKDFLLRSPNVSVKVNGKMQSDEALDFDMIAENIDVGKFGLPLPYATAGTAKFVGKLQGSVNAPIFDGALTGNEFVFNGESISGIDGKIHFANNKLAVTSFKFNQKNGKYSLSGSIDLDTQQMYGDLYVAHGNLEGLLKVLNIEQEWLTGNFDGNIHAEGTTKHPKVNILGVLNEGSLKKYKLDAMDLNLVIDGRVIDVKRFHAKQGNGDLRINGKFDLDGEIKADVKGENIAFGLLTSLADFDMDAQGVVNFGGEVSGTMDNPKAKMAMDVKNGGIRTAAFDALHGRMSLENNIIQVEQFSIEKGPYKASAEGLIPLAALTQSIDEKATLKDQMDLKIHLDDADLSILPFVTEQVDWAIGATKGDIVIGGTVAEPRINGALSVADGAVKFKALANPVQKMALDIEFKNDRIDLKTFSGIMGKGSYEMVGTSALAGRALKDYNFNLQLNHLDIVNKYYKGPLQGQFTVTEERGAPKVSGNLDFNDCTVDIPFIPTSDTPMPKIRMDIAVNVGKKVRLFNSFLYDMLLEGHVHFGGTTKRPKTSGEIHAIRGKVNYLKTPFKIREGSAYFNQVGSFLPSIHLNADTALNHTRVYLNIDGPVDMMNFKLTSDPAMNEQEIITLLTLRSGYKDKNAELGGEQLKDMVGIGLQMSFLSELENLVRNNMGLDEFTIVRDTLDASYGGSVKDREVYNVEIGKYINDKVMLKYTMGIDYDSHKYGIQYDLNSRYSINGEIDQKNKSLIGLEARIKF